MIRETIKHIRTMDRNNNLVADYHVRLVWAKITGTNTWIVFHHEYL